MRRPLKLTQFHVRHLLVGITVVAIFIQPSRVAFHWIVEILHSESTPVVTVPDGGTVIIGGMVFRPDSARQLPNGGRNLIDGVVRRDGTRYRRPPRDVASSKANNLVVTPRIIIQEDDEETLLLWPTSEAAANSE